MENPKNALVSLLPEDLLFVWPDGTPQKTMTAFSTSLKKAMAAGLSLKMKGERINGFGALLTFDVEVVTLLRDVVKTAGHSTPFFYFFQKYFILPTIEYVFFPI